MKTKYAKHSNSAKSNSSKKSQHEKALRGKQGSKDSSDTRVNFDNTRASKFRKAVEQMTTDKKPSNNDVSWYSNNPQMLTAAASIPFASVAGSNVAIDQNTFTVPGVMGIYYSPALGMDILGENESDASAPQYALNQSGKYQYSFIVHANSRNYSYEYQDLTILELAGASLFSLIAHMIRAYGVAKTYAEQNRYMPESLLTTMGFIPEDVRANLSQVWFDINELIARTSQIWIPNVMPLLQRWFWLNSNIFKDDNDVKGQIYMFVETNYWKYNEVLNDLGGGLEPATIPVSQGSKDFGEFNPAFTKYSWSQWMDMANSMINALINSEDRGIIFGDILNAYGQDKLYAISPIPVDYRVEPVYNQEVLTQIENLVAVQECKCMGVFQNTNGICAAWTKRSTGKVGEMNSAPSAGLRTNSILNFHFPTQPTPADIMVATRLVALDNNYMTGHVFNKTTGANGAVTYKLVEVASGDYVNAPRVCGSEVVNYIKVCNTPYNGGEADNSDSYPQFMIKTSLMTFGADTLKKYSAFDWHPFVYNCEFGGSYGTQGGYVRALEAYGDFANYTSLSKEILRKIHVTAMYSLFGIRE